MAVDGRGLGDNQLEPQALFRDVNFCIVKSKTLSEDESRRVSLDMDDFFLLLLC